MSTDCKKYECGHCERVVRDRDRAFACDRCDVWVHVICTTHTLKTYREVQQGKIQLDFYCNSCIGIIGQREQLESTRRESIDGNQNEINEPDVSNISKGHQKSIDFNSKSLIEHLVNMDNTADDKEEDLVSVDESYEELLRVTEMKAAEKAKGTVRFGCFMPTKMTKAPGSKRTKASSKRPRSPPKYEDFRLIKYNDGQVKIEPLTGTTDTSPKSKKKKIIPAEPTPAELTNRPTTSKIETVWKTRQDDNAPEPSSKLEHDYAQTSINLVGKIPVIKPNIIVESILPDADGEFCSSPEEFTILPKGTQRGKPLLVSSSGFSFVVKRDTMTATTWRCSVRNRKQQCHAIIVQNGESFQAIGEHDHEPTPGKLTKCKIVEQVKESCMQDVYKGSRAIVEEALKKNASEDDIIPKPDHLTRLINKHRAARRPPEPKDKNFEIQMEHIPEGFYRGEVKNGSKRHLIFASDRQLQLLANAKEWYADGTFKLVKQPFVQLYSIHSFITNDDGEQLQVPLVFIMMSGKSERDYRKVLKRLLELTPKRPRVKRITADFEKAFWNAARDIIDTDIKGCSFHWSQAVLRHVRGSGLATSYASKQGCYQLIRQVMALQYIPKEHIPEALHYLEAKSTDSLYQNLCQYVQTTWLDQWKPADWSQYQQPIRTNNDVEGWHSRLNKRCARGNGPPRFYELVNGLKHEADMLPLTAALLSQRKLKKRIRQKSEEAQNRLFNLWEQYEQGNITTSTLLEKAARFNCA